MALLAQQEAMRAVKSAYFDFVAMHGHWTTHAWTTHSVGDGDPDHRGGLLFLAEDRSTCTARRMFDQDEARYHDTGTGIGGIQVAEGGNTNQSCRAL